MMCIPSSHEHKNLDCNPFQVTLKNLLTTHLLQTHKMHLYPKQSRQFRPGFTSTSKPSTPFSQHSITFSQHDFHNDERQIDQLPRTLNQKVGPPLRLFTTDSKPREKLPSYNKAINPKHPITTSFPTTETLPSYPMAFWAKLVIRACQSGFLVMLMHVISVSRLLAYCWLSPKI